MNVAIIAAAGQGTRMGSGRAKQFLEVAGTPIIVHTARIFEQCEVIEEVIVVLPEADAAGFLALAGKYDLHKITQVVAGGMTRAESVCCGLRAVHSTTTEIVAVHDGVRPLVTAAEIARTVTAAQEHGAAILVSPLIDTIKAVEDGQVLQTLNRTRLRRALTPQCFRYSLLCRAYAEADVFDPDLTDESVLFERLGLPVAAVEGSSRNVKITRPEDLAIAEMLLNESV
jgi:2-C-methyl-D-erythritol 4-phosphate cytidylyltransferase